MKETSKKGSSNCSEEEKAELLLDIGSICLEKKDYGRAFRYLNMSLGEYRRREDNEGVCKTLRIMGKANWYNNNYEKAEDCFRKALDLRSNSGESPENTKLLSCMGITCLNRGKTSEAMRYMLDAVREARSLDDPDLLWSSLNRLGNLYDSLGSFDRSMECCIEAFDIADTAGNKRKKATSLNNMGLIRYAFKDYDGAEKDFREAFEITDGISDESSRADILNNLGMIFEQRKKPGKTLDLYRQSLDIRRTTGEKNKIAITLGNIGGIYLRQGDMGRAAKAFSEALSICREIGDLQGESWCLQMQSGLLVVEKDFPQAIEYLEQGLCLAREVRDRQTEMEILEDLSDCFSSIENHRKAYESLREAVRIRKEVFSEESCKRLASLQVVFDTGRKTKEAEKLLQESRQLEKLNMALRESEIRFRSLFEKVPSIAVQGYDSDRNLIFWNRASEVLYGYSKKEALGRKLEELIIPPHMREYVIKQIRNMIERNTTIPAGELSLMNKQGSLVPVFSSHVMIVNSQGQKEMYCLDVDLSENKRIEEEKRNLEEQIQNTQKLESLGVLAGGIAHDFNNLLMGVMGNANLAMKDLPEESPVRKRIRNIEKSARQAADLCRQMLAYSGRGRFLVEPVDLNELVKEIGQLLKTTVSEKATMVFDFTPDLPLLNVDASQMSQIIMNLITNAAESLDSSGTITITTSIKVCNARSFIGTYIFEDLSDGRYVIIEVNDTGRGMDKKTIDRIFDPFFTTKFTGRGLGLAAVLGIIRGHHGAIGVKSTPGIGTTFRVFLPSLEDISRTQEMDEQVEDLHISGSTILLVDDEEVVLDVGRMMLERIGFTVITAGDGETALQTFKKKQAGILCVILDLTMPGMSGEETYRQMLNIDPGASILISSGFSEYEISDRFTGILPEGFLHKPYTLDQLQNKIGKLLRPGQ